MTILSETKLQHLEMTQGLLATGSSATGAEFVPSDIRTEAEATVKVRTMQSFFRKMVLAAYDSKCCVTGNPVECLLVASHILPWNEYPQLRLNPRNGLCLAAHFDKAFDRHLIAFNSEMKLVLSPVLKSYLPNTAIELEFVKHEGQRLTAPDRFLPDADFLACHRDQMRRAD